MESCIFRPFALFLLENTETTPFFVNLSFDHVYEQLQNYVICCDHTKGISHVTRVPAFHICKNKGADQGCVKTKLAGAFVFSPQNISIAPLFPWIGNHKPLATHSG